MNQRRAPSYDPKDRRLRCLSLGGSEFELDGRLAEGPAKRPIVSYRARVEAGDLVIDL